MKTVSERLDAIEKEIDKIEQVLRRLSGQRALLHIYLPLSNMPQNEEVQIRHDPTTSWLKFCFLEGAIIYHAENYVTLVRKLLENQRLKERKSRKSNCEQTENYGTNKRRQIKITTRFY